MKWTKLVLVMLVVLVLILAYFAFVGWNASADNIGPDEDPTGQDRDPIAYAVVNVDIEVQNRYGYIQGRITDIGVDVYPWTGSHVMTTNKLSFKLSGFWEDEVTTWITTTVTGPGNYFFESEALDKRTDTIPELAPAGDTRYYSFGPYEADFYDPGTYTITITVHMDCDTEDTNAPVVLSESFEVS